MKKLIPLFHIFLLFFSCSNDNLKDNSVEAKKLSPIFEATTTPIHVLSNSTDIRECFYQNNFVKLVGYEPSVSKHEWYRSVGNEEYKFLSSDSIFTTSLRGNYRLDIEQETPGVGEKDSSIYITLEYCDTYIDVPTSFTPDADNQFDTWFPILVGVSDFYVRVSDDMNNVLFESESYNTLFDGSFEGNQLPSGSYNYYISGTYRTGYLFEQQGIIELVR